MKNLIQQHAALYCRISKGPESNIESNSIANQKILLQKSAQAYGYEHTRFYVEACDIIEPTQALIDRVEVSNRNKVKVIFNFRNGLAEVKKYSGVA